MRPKFGTSYSIGIKDGWISYLYSSHPLSADTVSSSDRIPLRDLLRCYRSLSSHAIRHAVGHSLVYGRLYLPQNRLEALLAARVTPAVNLTLRAVSQESLRHGGTLLGLASWDDPRGRFGIETLASSDGGVLGLRGLWNATNPPSSPAVGAAKTAATTATTENASPSTTITTSGAQSPSQQTNGSDPSGDRERINGRFSAGGEIYYGMLNKSGGVSLGGRFQTLPTHHGTPLTAALTFNLLGHMSATYAVMAGDCTLASQFGFNVYSYESEWAVGMELWNKKRPAAAAAVAVPPSSGEGAGGKSEYGGGMRELEVDGGGDPVVAVMAEPTPSAAVMMPSTGPAPARKRIKERSFQAKLEWRLDDDNEIDTVDAATPAEIMATNNKPEHEFPDGVFKCRCDQHMRIGLMYEGRYKSLLFSLGTDVDLKKLDAPFRTVGLAVQFSS